MKKLFLSLMFAFSSGILADDDLTPRCSGSLQDEDSGEIELVLENGSYQIYHDPAGERRRGYTLKLSKTDVSFGSIHYSGYMDLVFTGGGSANWVMNLINENSHRQKEGVLTLSFYNSHNEINYGNGHSGKKYNVTCD